MKDNSLQNLAKGGKGEHQRRGGTRYDRAFKICITLPPGVHEDLVMDFLETAVCSAVETMKKWEPNNPLSAIDIDKISVKRKTPRYKDMVNWEANDERK